MQQNDIQDGAERIEVLKSRIQDAQDTIQSNRKQATIAKERRQKAERLISICNAKVKSRFHIPIQLQNDCSLIIHHMFSTGFGAPNLPGHGYTEKG